MTIKLTPDNVPAQVVGPEQITTSNAILKSRTVKVFINAVRAGVVAINFSFVEKILGILGSINVKGKKFTINNLFALLTSTVSNIDKHDINVFKINCDRKSILKDLFFKLITSLILKFWKWPVTLKLVEQSFKTKDLQIHFFNPKLQKNIIKKGLVESFSSNDTTDFLAIVENNYLGLKANRYLRRTVFHDVQFFFDRERKVLSEATVKVRIRTDHFGTFNYPLSGTYQSVTNISIPKLAKNIKILSAGVTLQHEKDLQVLNFHKILRIGETAEIAFQYQLPAELFHDNTYSFQYIKQSGVQHEHIFETVSYPDQYQLSINNKQANLVESKMLFEQTNLDRSYSYTLNGKFHLQTPRVFFHEIVSPSLIQIRFNEPVYPTNDSDHHKQIKVMNAKTGTEYNVEKIQFTNDNRYLFIKVAALPQVEETFYHVHLSQLQNAVGVVLQHPKKVTVIYRSKNFRPELFAVA